MDRLADHFCRKNAQKIFRYNGASIAPIGALPIIAEVRDHLLCLFAAKKPPWQAVAAIGLKPKAYRLPLHSKHRKLLRHDHHVRRFQVKQLGVPTLHNRL